MRDFIIWGVGQELEKFMEEYPLVNLNSIRFIDSNKVGKYIGNYLIESKEILKNISPTEVMIVISSSLYYEEIQREVLMINPNFNCISLKNLFEHLSNIGYCNICHHDIKSWGYCGNHIYSKYEIVGNGKRIGLCPYCGSYDRNRWYYYVIKNYTSLFEEGGSVLHFAPEKSIEKQFKKNSLIEYYTADIEEGVADYVVDMTNIPFDNNKFDYIFANHVL